MGAEGEVDLESFGTKKKKKKSGKIDEDDENKENEGDSNDTTAWANQDRDYTYDELLSRVYGIIKDKNPDSIMGDGVFRRVSVPHVDKFLCPDLAGLFHRLHH